jgi:hypothetical protein
MGLESHSWRMYISLRNPWAEAISVTALARLSTEWNYHFLVENTPARNIAGATSTECASRRATRGYFHALRIATKIYSFGYYL